MAASWSACFARERWAQIHVPDESEQRRGVSCDGETMSGRDVLRWPPSRAPIARSLWASLSRLEELEPASGGSASRLAQPAVQRAVEASVVTLEQARARWVEAGPRDRGAGHDRPLPRTDGLAAWISRHDSPDPRSSTSSGSPAHESSSPTCSGGVRSPTARPRRDIGGAQTRGSRPREWPALPAIGMMPAASGETLPDQVVQVKRKVQA